MIKSVHIPVFCENPELMAGAVLAFKTVRVGFPSARITVHWMGRVCPAVLDYFETCEHAGKSWVDKPFVPSNGRTTNDELLRQLVYTEEESFAMIDSDMVFFKSCEDFETKKLICGEFIPQFYCPIATAITRSRLHTAFFVVSSPILLRETIKELFRPLLPKFCPVDFFAPQTTFIDGKAFFYDSAAMLFQAIGGESFSEEMLDKYEHLYSGSYSHLLPPFHQELQKKAIREPETAKGFRKIVMNKYFSERLVA